jgi:hypothetical protein
MRSLIICIFLIPFVIWSQDGLSPLMANPDLFHKQQMTMKSGGTFDSTFVYLSDTIGLPLFDEFSKNNFQQYPTDFSGPGVSSQLFHRLLDVNTSVPLPILSRFTTEQTYRLEINLIDDTIIQHYYDSTRFLFDPLSSYPVDYVNIYGYPPYIVLDTIDVVAHAPDTVWLENPEFIQDSARLFFVELNDPTKYWLNDQAYHNYRLAKEPWSIGVVSFDGLDENGYPYFFGSTMTAMCDTLLSKPIDMTQVAISDTVYFSFLYQTEGYGDVPESGDSLFLEFYSPVDMEWTRMFRTAGAPVSDFKVAHIKVDDPKYFHKGFQFRFMNYGSPAGFLDHFHIDYVHLRGASGFQDTLFKDFAFVYPISTLLKDYTSVPWKHYRNHPAGKMSDEVKVAVRNGSELTENNQNGNVAVFRDNNLEGSFVLNGTLLSGGQINYAPRTTYISYHDFSTGYAFDHTLLNDTLAVFDWRASASAQFPSYPQNDSTFGQQVFRNYYAYDDGTAEKAYGVIGAQSQLAHKFEAYQADSLIAIDVHFVPSVVDVSNNLFLFAVWDDNNGQPGNKIYEDEFFFPRQPKFTSERNRFTTYYFKDTMKIAVGETFYIGMRQIDEDRLNIGFDMNHDNSDKVFWSVDGGNQWFNASFPGSLMMRPVVTSKLDYTLGLPTILQQELEAFEFQLYPNPADQYFRLILPESEFGYSIVLTDLHGRRLLNMPLMDKHDIHHLDAGIYMVSVFENGQFRGTKKLVVR